MCAWVKDVAITSFLFKVTYMKSAQCMNELLYTIVFNFIRTLENILKTLFASLIYEHENKIAKSETHILEL